MQIIRNKWISLFSCNFLGVFNDNFLKNGIIFIAIAWTLPSWLTHSQLIAVIGSCLVFPYLIFSPLGGRLSVRFSKMKVYQTMKLLELPIMFVACIAFYFQRIELAIISMLLMGVQSSLYSPSKYSLIRDIGGEEGVSFGSGVFETMAFLGILFGTYAASVVSDNYSIFLFSIIILGVALLGFITSKQIKTRELPVEKSESETLNPIKFVKQNYLFARQHHLVNSAVFGSSAFWLISNMVQMNTIIHCKNIFHVSNSKIGLVMAFAAIGIAIGTSLTGKFSGTKVQKGLIIPALIGMILCLVSIIFIPLSFAGYAVLITLFALLAGVFQVPCMAIVQHADLKRRRGDTFAYLNMMNFVFILIGTGLFSLITALTDENSYVVFIAMVVLILAIMIYFLAKYPDFRIKFY